MNLSTKLALEPDPRNLFHCCKCNRAPEGVEAHTDAVTTKIELTCHGESLSLEYQAHAERETPIKVWKPL